MLRPKLYTYANTVTSKVDIGLAADIGTLSRLPKIVGSYSWVKDICLSARVFGVAEALRHGFISTIKPTKAEAVAEAIKLGALISSKSPVAVNGTKDILNFSRDHSVKDGLHYTAVWNAAMLQTTDVPSAMQAGMAKRIPTFEKL
jgi:Delta3,5-Delta2,4-dienoyl-CoA isomerase